MARKAPTAAEDLLELASIPGFSVFFVVAGLGFRVQGYTNCIGFGSGVLIGFERVSVLPFDLYNLYLSGLVGFRVQGLGFSVTGRSGAGLLG